MKSSRPTLKARAKKVIFTVALILALLPGAKVRALSTLHFFPSPSANGQSVVMANSRPVLRLSADNQWKAFLRARAVALVLNALSEEARFEPFFEVRKVKGMKTIWGGGRKVTTVTAFDVKATGLSSEKLASLWVESITKAFSLPHLAVSPQRLTVGVGEWAEVWIRAVPTKVEAKIEPPQAADVSIAPGGRAAIIVAKSPGRAKLVICNPAAELTVSLEVKYRAAYLKEAPRAIVTSLNPSDEVIKWAALNAVYRGTALREGAKGKVLSLKILRQGRIGALVPFVAFGPDYLEWRKELLVVPVVMPMGLPEPELLVVSNWPERVNSPRTLALHPLDRGKTVRVLYHHLNATGRKLEFSVDLLNFGQEVAEVQVVPACPEPGYSPTSVGHAAVVRYFRRRLGKDSFLAETGPRERRSVVRHTVRPGEVVSGLLEMNLLSETEIALAVEATRPGRPWVEPINDLADSLKHSTRVYPRPLKIVKATAKVGERWLYLHIGEEPLRAVASEHVLLGNYGVVYRFEITVENPFEKEVEVPFLFYPRGGIASGTFVIDGRIEHFRAIAPRKMKQIASLRVPAGSGRLVEVLTMPEPGSYYPASLVVKTTGLSGD